ncbi:hypothetical protein BJ508DRAFT_416410 [Ascobolus immersus RN42]|uniref:Uncharacterized protein n=1 Tax=Ascobolus immersus RN42 TaxID=1160509 RepID=A0A3N4IA96_ASCIM|nr:hypothetical protein BJ508DRAFT_416410 [Ascobolus immersus RN42]
MMDDDTHMEDAECISLEDDDVPGEGFEEASVDESDGTSSTPEAGESVSTSAEKQTLPSKEASNLHTIKELRQWKCLGPDPDLYVQHYGWTFMDDEEGPDLVDARMLYYLWDILKLVYPVDDRKLPSGFYAAHEAYLRIVLGCLIPKWKELLLLQLPDPDTEGLVDEVRPRYYEFDYNELAGLLFDLLGLGIYTDCMAILYNRRRAGLLRGEQADIVAGLLWSFVYDYRTLATDFDMIPGKHDPLSDLNAFMLLMVYVADSQNDTLNRYMDIRSERIELLIMKYLKEEEVCWDVVDGIALQTALKFGIPYGYDEDGRVVYRIAKEFLEENRVVADDDSKG